MVFIWASPLGVCDCCDGDFDGVMFDATIRVRPGGPRGWGNFCLPCFDAGDGKLGTGLGQRYDLQTLEAGGKAWVKTAG